MQEDEDGSPNKKRKCFPEEAYHDEDNQEDCIIT